MFSLVSAGQTLFHAIVRGFSEHYTQGYGIDVQVKGRLTWPWTGAILGSSDNPMQDVDFRRVIADPLVRDRWLLPNQRQSYYACTGADGSHKFSAPTPKCLTGGAHQQRRRPTEDEKDL